MEIVTANVSKGFRIMQMMGREYYVANAVLIVPGVLPGSRGPLLYPDSVVSSDVMAWNGMPLTGYHPRASSGKHRTARDPDVLNSQGIGQTFRAAYNSQLAAEPWFDVDATKRFDETLAPAIRILPRLKNGEPIELSTGLFTKTDAVANTWKDGKKYQGTVLSMKPDHVAVLPDQVGACSLKDGCGILVNELAPEHLKEVYWKDGDKWRVANAMMQCSECGKTVTPDEDGKCPECGYKLLENERKPKQGNRLQRALVKLLLGERKPEPAQAAPAPVPAENSDMASKAENVAWLTTNCDCWKGQQAELEKLSDKQIQNLRDKKEAEITANAARPPAPPPPPPSDQPPPWATALIAKVDGLVANQQAGEAARKAQLVEKLVANAAEPAKAQLKATYELLPVANLEGLVAAMPAPRRAVFAAPSSGGQRTNSAADAEPKKDAIVRPAKTRIDNVLKQKLEGVVKPAAASAN